MPTIPTYDQAQVQSQALPSVQKSSNASPNLFSAGAENLIQTGQMLQEGGAQLGKVVVHLQDQRNADMLFRAETALNDEYRDFQNILRDRKGINAWGMSKDVTKWWEDKFKAYSENLENDAQRGLLAQRISKMRESSLDTFSRFEAEQRRNSLNESATASMTSAISIAAADASNAPKMDRENPEAPLPFDVSDARDKVIKNIKFLAASEGWTPDMVQAKATSMLTNLHEQVIRARADIDPVSAKIYFETFKAKGEIDGTHHDNIRKLLQTAGNKETAQNMADQLEAAGLSESAGLKQIRKKLSGEEEETAVREWTSRWAQRSAARERSQAEANDAAYRVFSKTNSVDSIPSTVLNSMDPKALMSLKKEEHAVKSGATIETNWDTYYQLELESANNPKKFASRDLRVYFGDLNPTQRQTLTNLQKAVIKNPGGALKLDDEIKAAIAPLGLDKKQIPVVNAKIRAALDSEKDTIGRGLTQDERTRVINSMLVKGEVPGFILDPNKRYYELTPDEKTKFKPFIPDKDLADITSAFRLQGQEPTQEMIIKAYVTKHPEALK